MLVLNTCQRLECYGPELPDFASAHIQDNFSREGAFERLARIAAGLESRILGELEILGQVRSAYKEFKVAQGPRKGLDPIYQKALQLGRKARRESGIDQKITSISGIAAQELLKKIEPGVPVAVIGSGSIASSAARYLSKRGTSPLCIISRCPENAVELADRLGGFGAGMDGMGKHLQDVGGILCATSAPHPILFDQHLSNAQRPLTIIDLGEPADCDASVAELAGVEYLDLLDVEKRANINSEYRSKCAEIAARIVKDGAAAWASRN
jgi:glutamyl-tRNA reductase